jgi:hypothetical protein
MVKMELGLGAVLGREVELRTHEDLSRYFRDDLRAQARVLYAAWRRGPRSLSSTVTDDLPRVIGNSGCRTDR